MSGIDLEVIYGTALELAAKAGEMIRDAFWKEKSVDTKMSAADLVTETDQAVESTVKAIISAKYPNHKFIGEETTAAAGNHCVWTDEPTWIIDPIDGTTNFVHSIPEVTFSLGFTLNKQVVIGVVYAPIKDELFTAKLNQGAFLNGKKLTVNKTKDISKAVVIMEGGSSRDVDIVDKKIKNIYAMVSNSHGVRAYGSAALNLSHIAAGRGDAYVEYGIHVWDFIAGALIAKEAGATVLDPTGSELDYMHRRVLCACTPEVANQISEKLIHLDMGFD
ncbi:inositol monophosphatase 2 [Biomphalaria pfeifferi]|uniref:Inositol-1-monophosphatase n=1 Tax=Biomphalaria pfeifferi TaxID=112525 RepID=A0AAD8BW11_BIOPF|nr:inositol monophosphatase 2 [Biomphalaria pfeifferi]